MNKPQFHWHTGCSRCLHADSYPPERLILHTGYGTIYSPRERNLTDTTLSVAGFIAANSFVAGKGFAGK